MIVMLILAGTYKLFKIATLEETTNEYFKEVKEHLTSNKLLTEAVFKDYIEQLESKMGAQELKQLVVLGKGIKGNFLSATVEFVKECSTGNTAG